MTSNISLVWFFTDEAVAVRVVAGVADLLPTVLCHVADPVRHRRQLDEGGPGPDQDPIKAQIFIEEYIPLSTLF